jgi:hypothetical protein
MQAMVLQKSDVIVRVRMMMMILMMMIWIVIRIVVIWMRVVRRMRMRRG